MNDENVYVPRCRNITWSEISHKNVIGKLPFLCINIRSLRGKFEEFMVHISALKGKLSFLAITESWLKKDDNFLYEIDGYKSVNAYREDAMGGGIKLYYQDHINVTCIEIFFTVQGACESLLIKSKIPGLGKLNICAVYRPPQRSVFGQCFKLLRKHQNSYNIIGDFNLSIKNLIINYRLKII